MGLAANANHLWDFCFLLTWMLGFQPLPRCSYHLETLALLPMVLIPWGDGDSQCLFNENESKKMEKVQSEFTRSKFRTEAKGDLALPFWTLHCGEKKTLRFISFESSMTEYRWHNVEVVSNQWAFFSSTVWNLWRKKKADTDTNKPYQNNCRAWGPGHFDSGTVFFVISESFLQMQT